MFRKFAVSIIMNDGASAVLSQLPKEVMEHGALIFFFDHTLWLINSFSGFYDLLGYSPH